MQNQLKTICTLMTLQEPAGIAFEYCLSKKQKKTQPINAGALTKEIAAAKAA
jgi:hypothetical protein